jgi:hypothetical protein
MTVIEITEPFQANEGTILLQNTLSKARDFEVIHKIELLIFVNELLGNI